jgi:predicted PurR-regulated permease PerM
VSVGDVVGLIFAVAFAVGVLAVCFLLWKLTKVVEETRKLVEGITTETVPLLSEVTTSVVHVNEELVRVDAITSNVQSISANASSLASLFAATLGGPLVKVAAFSYGVRRVAAKRQHDDLEKRIKTELKASKKARK